MKHRIILASASPRRRELLGQVGITPEIIPSTKEEVISSSDPEQVVLELSRQKARDVAADRGKGAIVIGADTVVAAGGEILGKPENTQDAVRMIELLQGNIHQVYTGVTLILTGEKEHMVSFVERTDVHVYPMTSEEILHYVTSGESVDKAGAYGIQGRFAAYIQGIAGDYSNVVGLPVGRTCQELKKLDGFQEE